MGARTSDGEDASRQDEVPFDVQVGIDRLFVDTHPREQPHTLVLASEQLHQRNLRLKLREDARLQRSHDICRFVDASRAVLQASEERVATACLDRIDRLRSIEEGVTSDGFVAADALAADELSQDALLDPLALGWLPTDADDRWPVGWDTISTARRTLDGGERTAAAWQRLAAEAGLDRSRRSARGSTTTPRSRLPRPRAKY